MQKNCRACSDQDLRTKIASGVEAILVLVSNSNPTNELGLDPDIYQLGANSNPLEIGF
jgi:hypothetical protein